MWQFRLDTEDNLLRRGRLPCSRVVANHSGLQPSISPLPTTPSADDDVAASEVATLKCIAVEDFRRSRLFERLARLLESLIVTTRMLPGWFWPRVNICYLRAAWGIYLTIISNLTKWRSILVKWIVLLNTSIFVVFLLFCKFSIHSLETCRCVIHCVETKFL